jgi:hypothetical protein
VDMMQGRTGSKVNGRSPSRPLNWRLDAVHMLR